MPPMPPSGNMSSFNTMPYGSMPPQGAPFGSGASFGGSPTPPMPPHMGSSFPPPGTMPPGSMPNFNSMQQGSMPPGMNPFGSMSSVPPGSMMMPGTTPPASFNGTGNGMMPPQTMPPGSFTGMPQGNEPVFHNARNHKEARTLEEANLPTFGQGGMIDHNVDDGPAFGRGPVLSKSQGLHHGFGHADSFASQAQAAHSLAMMRRAGVIEPGAPPIGVETASRSCVVVGEYRPLYPAPATGQYGMSVQNVEAAEVRVQEQWCSKDSVDMSPLVGNIGTWGRANLKHICDASMMNWKDRMITASVWSYIHADGWNINFWPKDFATTQATDSFPGKQMVPIASIDIRQIFAVNISKDASTAEGAQCPWEVHINFKTGYFPFSVRTQQEAEAWNARIMRGVVENVKLNSMRQNYAEYLITSQGEPNLTEKDPARIASLKKIWHQSLESVGQGVQPSKQVFFNLYNLYDAIEGEQSQGDLTMAEIEIMAKELLELKAEEVRAELVRQEKVLFSSHRPVTSGTEMQLRRTIDQGRALLAHYDRQRDPKEFFDRVVNFHHKTDISREGKVDITEFLNSAPIFLLPIVELRHEALFFKASRQACPQITRRQEQDVARLRLSGKTREEEEAECKQQ